MYQIYDLSNDTKLIIYLAAHYYLYLYFSGRWMGCMQGIQKEKHK
jgi:hypothetical protein